MNKFQKVVARFLIPKGFYCYGLVAGKRVYCPFYSINSKHDEQENGYCSYLRKGDWDIWDEYQQVSHLWDACKECSVNYGR
jgi:hypothetical protein